jgi:very-short-patch-repair endonuclease
MSSDATLSTQLDDARRGLLDPGTRNRLVSTSRSSSRSGRLEIVDECSEDVYRHLVIDKKAMSFLPIPEEDGSESDDDQVSLFQPEEDQVLDGNESAARYVDDKLQTELTSDRLQKKLLKLYHDARTYEEEQGVNILFLALGFLKWYEDQNSDRERFAPLLLIPVALDRTSATSQFKIRYTDDDILTNLSLQARLKADFGIELSDVPDIEDLSPTKYFEAVANVIRDELRWEVLPNDIVLWFFSFSKFLMYRDLHPDHWPEHQKLDVHPLISALLRDGFHNEPPLCGEDESIDKFIPPIEWTHILDADSSQAVAIEEVKRGRSLVLQGPPGTGKSQTIANLIGAAVKAGKRVLFVAEKKAALEVVRRRLDNIKLGDMCLELHSNKANKRAVLQELESTLQLGQPQVDGLRMLCDQLGACRDSLNQHLEVIHTPIQPSGMTPYQVVGELVRLQACGTKPPKFRLCDPLKWSRAEFQCRLNQLRDLVEHLSQIGVPCEHPWRGVEMDLVLPTDVERIQTKVTEVSDRLQRLVNAGLELANALGVPPAKSALELSRAALLAQRLDSAPPMDRRSMGHPAWNDQRRQIDQVLEAGTRLRESRSQLAGTMADVAWDTDVVAARRALAAHGRSWFRLCYKTYRQAQATLTSIVAVQAPGSLRERLALLDCLILGQQSREYLESTSAGDLGRDAFGYLWNGTASDWVALSAIASWEAACREAKVDPRFREILSALDPGRDIRSLLRRIGQDLKPFVAELQDLSASVRLNLMAAIGVSDPLVVPFRELATRLRQWQETPEELSRWVAYHVRRRQVCNSGMAELVSEVDAGRISASEAVSCCELAYYEELIRDTFGKHQALATFEGASHGQVIEKFRSLDKRRIDLARHEVAMSHFERIPRVDSDVGEVGLVRREIQKKRRHLPIRKLLANAGRAVQAIKPVFMMSPISVAQYLEPGAIDFDLMLIDEASQVEPIDALGAIARARQIVVVGDSKQLPPTRFFTRFVDDDGQAEPTADEVQATDMESILGLCCAQGVPQRMLRWHYRSRHHSLIALSNHEFYNDQLFVVPSPAKPLRGQGLAFRFVEQGAFDRGGSATNRMEAQSVAKAVMAHARDFPDRSLGVGTFSVAQRDAILDELELLRRSEPSLESFFATGVAEPFFVKNLENIQGDERDAIFISVGYGKDASGYMAMNFGPLSNDGGERRLNVLITRARESCSVFSSIVADDIDLVRARSRGAAALKAFLKYAQTGLLDTGSPTGRGHDSEFERQVAVALAAQGYETHPQVGVAGFFIDLAVVDPDVPGRYLLGIECDGANYHRARSARDRDRLRTMVLEDRGWIIHRIWSTDWFHRPQEQLRKTLAAIEQAKVTWASRAQNENDHRRTPDIENVEIKRTDLAEDCCEGNACAASKPYVVAIFQIQSSQEIHEVPDLTLARVITKIVEIEGPIHCDEIARRVTQLWGLQRTGRRIRDAVMRALPVACRTANIGQHGKFYSCNEQPEIIVRDRSNVTAATLRDPDMLPPAEIRQALVTVVRTTLGVERGAAVTEVARLFGFRSTSSQLRQVIDRQVDAMIKEQRLVDRNGTLRVS